MNKLLLLLALLGFSTALTHAMPCETYEPYCEGEEHGDNDESDDADPQRPDDPNGPDYTGDESEI